MPWAYEATFYNTLQSGLQVTSAPGVLKGILIGAAVAGNITIYDGDANAATQIVQLSSNQVGMFELNARISVGLRMSCPASAAVTLFYK